MNIDTDVVKTIRHLLSLQVRHCCQMTHEKDIVLKDFKNNFTIVDKE